MILISNTAQFQLSLRQTKSLNTLNVTVFCFVSRSDLIVESFVSLQVPGAQDLVDFSPVYRCLHIYTVLVSYYSNHDCYCLCLMFLTLFLPL